MLEAENRRKADEAERLSRSFALLNRNFEEEKKAFHFSLDGTRILPVL